MNNLQQPTIDIEKINKAANEAAEDAYLQAIKDYYTGYGSPYNKMIKDELGKQKISYNMELPNILAEINKGLCAEIDKIANNAIASTYIPMISKTLLRVDKNQKLSEILQEIVNDTFEAGVNNVEDYSFSYEKDERYGWLDCKLDTPDTYYKFTLHAVHYKLAEGQKQEYQFLSLPSTTKNSGQKMTLKKDGIEIEMPFAPNILNDKVIRVFCNLMLSGCIIDVDCEDFEDEMFENDEYYD